MGYIDPNSGTHFYEPTDPLAATAIATVLNTAQTADHNARLADRARITDLEENALVIHTITPANFITLGTGYSYQVGTPQVIRRIGARIEFALRLVKSTPIGHGDSVGVVKVEWSPIAGSEWQLTAQQAGGLPAAVISVALDVNRRIVPLSPNGQSTLLAVSGFYHMV